MRENVLAETACCLFKANLKTAATYLNVGDFGQGSRYRVCLHRRFHSKARTRRTEFLICTCLHLQFLKAVNQQHEVRVSEPFHKNEICSYEDMLSPQLFTSISLSSIFGNQMFLQRISFQCI